ncbi:MAG TPA: protoporphyrinogen oxidase [Bryobacteraceae bacterium]|nr:protoporphyrinogen oxidase [Bryobacteraceae bacterium]
MLERVLIVGGGVSGLATAYFLSKAGIPSTIVEKANRLGGLIKTDLIEGCRLEAGPDSYIASKPAVTELARELPVLAGQVMGSNDEARRIFVARGGKLVPMPKGMVMMVPGQWGPLLRSPLLSLGGKWRILKETLSQPRHRAEDISVGRLVEDHFGHEVLEYLTEPLLCGVYGGDSANLSAQSVLPRFAGYEEKYGSLVKGIRREVREKPNGPMFLSLRDGMQALTDALSGAIADSTNVIHAEATHVERSSLGWRLKAGGAWLQASRLVLACPAHAAGKLLQTEAAPLSAELSAIPYSSAILAMLVYDRTALDHPLDGFGFLVPQAERKTIAAATWINTKFPSRLPAGRAALRGFIVGEEAHRLLNVPQAEIIARVREDFRRFMGITSTPLFSTVHFWPDSMPQYVVGHNRRQQSILKLLGGYPGLGLVGNAYDGVGVPDCVRRAKELVKQIAEPGVYVAERYE